MKIFESYDLAELTETIDWTPFFQSWELWGKFPNILKDKVVGEQATKLYEDAKVMLKRMVDEKLVTARAVIGFFPANAVGDDVELYTDESRSEVLQTFSFLRQQMQKGKRHNSCLADYIAPKETGKKDYLGFFACTAGVGVDEVVAKYEADHDDYNSILFKALADRFAEAFTERLHQRVRTEFWNYVPDESLDNEALILEQYQGIRPAPGYPACPDHTEKGKLFELLDATENAGISLTESFAMMPTAAVSGYYFSHPESAYFGLGKIAKDQVEEYAERKGESVEWVERWLAPNLGY